MMRMSERLYVPNFLDARADHIARYVWANSYISPMGKGLDVFCGCGYGTHALRSTLRQVTGIDGSEEAIGWAKEHFADRRFTNGDFLRVSWPDPWFDQEETQDFVVSLESLEHVRDPDLFFKALARTLKRGGVMVVSSPNEDVLPKLPGSFPHHTRHVPTQELLGWGKQAGLRLISLAGQDVYELNDERRVVKLLRPSEMDVDGRIAGQFTLAAFRKRE